MMLTATANVYEVTRLAISLAGLAIGIYNLAQSWHAWQRVHEALRPDESHGYVSGRRRLMSAANVRNELLRLVKQVILGGVAWVGCVTPEAASPAEPLFTVANLGWMGVGLAVTIGSLLDAHDRWSASLLDQIELEGRERRPKR